MAGPDIPRDVLRLAEAFVFASPEPVTWKTLRPLLPENLDPVDVFAALQTRCAGRGINLTTDGDGWTFRTAPDLAAQLQTALTKTRRLPRAALECLVVIAYGQPLTRSDVEEIRGVSLSQASLDILLETGLIQPWGHRTSQGRPTLWVTTPRFLSQFGLQSLHDLPGESIGAHLIEQRLREAAEEPNAT